jgi:di/tripeptidase
MLDSDLAVLYGIETGRLNEQVKRNQKRFPPDFMFQLTEEEAALTNRKYLPYVFTENGVAMLSGVLNSDRAISVNIAIMRTFTKLRSFLALESSNSHKINELDKSTNKMFKVVFERLDDLDSQVTHDIKTSRKKIGLKSQGN